MWLPADAADGLPPHPLLRVAEAGGTFRVGTLDVRVLGERHAEVHPELPGPLNRAYLVAGAVLVTGDEHPVPDVGVRALVTPVDAPWLRATDLIRYVRRVRPDLVVGVPDGLLNDAGLAVARSVTARLEHEGSHRARLLADGESVAVSPEAPRRPPAEPS